MELQQCSTHDVISGEDRIETSAMDLLGFTWIDHRIQKKTDI